MVKVIKRIGAWTAFFSFCFIQFALADQLVISGDYAFLADGNLKIYNIKEPSDTDPEVITIGNATEVAVSGSKAIVTSFNIDTGVSIHIVDISAYVEGESDTSDCDSNTYLGTFDIQEGTIHLPGVAVNDTIYTLVMKRRGNSNNWEVIFSQVADDDDDAAADDEDDEDDEDEGDDI